jgi:hypothetical protein
MAFREGDVGTIVQHTTMELHRGLVSALGGVITPELREVEDELRLAGFLTGISTVTPAGRRFLGTSGGSDECSRLAA